MDSMNEPTAKQWAWLGLRALFVTLSIGCLCVGIYGAITERHLLLAVPMALAALVLAKASDAIRAKHFPK
jgi:hypothetical protein